MEFEFGDLFVPYRQRDDIRNHEERIHRTQNQGVATNMVNVADGAEQLMQGVKHLGSRMPETVAFIIRAFPTRQLYFAILINVVALCLIMRHAFDQCSDILITYHAASLTRLCVIIGLPSELTPDNCL